MAARERAVPSGRLQRLSSFGQLAGGIAGSVVTQGARQLAAGERPQLRSLLLTPANARRVSDQLSKLRGAAMKMGQMLSMDAGDLLPPELSDILAQLRERAHYMPPPQLEAVLAKSWGAGWRRKFRRFGATPIAAASIGQVHRATLPDGREVAVKVQYPGVARSIDADVDNVATLLRLSGLVPGELDVKPLLAEAKRQLHEEADYAREAAHMTRFADLLADDPDILVPRPLPEWSDRQVLMMDFVEGVAIEKLDAAPQDERDRAMRVLIDLVLRELFRFGLMQTDPNFANYRYQPASGKLVLLDFGATRSVTAATRAGYFDMLMAGLDGDRAMLRERTVSAGFVGASALARHPQVIDRMIDVILAEMNRPGAFDFGDRAFVGALREHGMVIAADRDSWHIPPAETLFVQRKISGTAMLAARLGARVDVRTMVAEYRDCRQRPVT